MTHTLPSLPYDYNALEPHIDVKTMEIHHSKHHQGYVNKLNAALKNDPETAEKPLEEILRNPQEIPENIRQTVINTGGGHYNHSLFWKTMSPDGGGMASGELEEALIKKFGSFEKFKEEFSNAAATQFGSGWAWLSKDSSGELSVSSTSNQDTPLSKGLTPILCLDVWEHAYYLHYQNRRPDFISAWWEVVNWEEVAKNYSEQ